MQDPEEFRKYAHELVDWIADYYKNIEAYPVRSQLQPREVFDQLPDAPPISGETMEAIMQDFRQIIMPGITHWQHPAFFAYFPANASFPSQLGEMLMSALGAQCMIWETSPAAAELEEKVMNWLRDMLGLPATFSGVIQDTASTATLSALLTAREKKSNYEVNEKGLREQPLMRVYCSTETHSSIEKDVKIMGLGRQNLVKIPVDEQQAMRADLLLQAIEQDIAQGYQPLAVVAALGTTGTLGFDPLAEIASICREYRLWLHVDAAYAGSAFILPEYRHYLEGIALADSFVFNPHKWLMTHFDCSAYFVQDTQALINTFSILPEYLKTATRGQVNDYRDWGIPLGRRFRALKLWFVLRSFGVEGLQQKIRQHVKLSEELVGLMQEHPAFELLVHRMNLIGFRLKASAAEREEELNQQLMQRLNASGELYLTHTRLHGKMLLRIVIGQSHVEERHVRQAWENIRQAAEALLEEGEQHD
ncbi:MAG: pyridoxal phosphate-dependent decarboxylase family protein [Cyclobacteriaceae bacterium]